MTANGPIEGLQAWTIDSTHGGEQPISVCLQPDQQSTQRQGGSRDLSAQLDALQQRVADARSAAQAAATKSRDQLRQRIDQAQVDINLAVNDAVLDATLARSDADADADATAADA